MKVHKNCTIRTMGVNNNPSINQMNMSNAVMQCDVTLGLRSITIEVINNSGFINGQSNAVFTGTEVSDGAWILSNQNNCDKVIEKMSLHRSPHMSNVLIGKNIYQNVDGVLYDTFLEVNLT